MSGHLSQFRAAPHIFHAELLRLIPIPEKTLPNIIKLSELRHKLLEKRAKAGIKDTLSINDGVEPHRIDVIAGDF